MSMIEFTSLMRYVLNGNTYPWPLLSDQAVRGHVCHDFRAYVEGVQDVVWRSHLPAYGWLVLTDPEHVNEGDCTEAQMTFMRDCAQALLRCNLPGHAWASFFAQTADGRAEPEDVIMPNVKQEPRESGELPESVPVKKIKGEVVPGSVPVKKIKTEPSDAISARELESLLTRGSLCKAPGRERCDLAQVAHGLLAACKHWGQELWNKRFGVVNVGNEERGQLLRRQLHVQTCFGIVYSPSHWCLLVLHRPPASPPIAYLYDGLASAVCADSAQAFLCHAQNAGWTQSPLSLTLARVSRQPDEWSCGHRVIIKANLVLAHLHRFGTLPQSMDGPTSQDVEVFLAEASRGSSATNHASSSSHKPPAAASPPARASDDPLDVDDEEAVVLADLQPPAGCQTPKRRARTGDSFLDRSGSRSEGDAMSPPAVSPMVARVRRRAATKQSTPADRPAKKVKLRAADCQVSHTTFQKKHYEAGIAPPQGHWHSFLGHMQGGTADPVACAVCRQLLHENKDGHCERVLRHEQYKTHVEGLRKLRGDAAIQPANAGAQKADPAGPRRECAGLLASKLVLKDSIETFVQFGQPRLLYNEHETDWLASVSFQVLPQDIAVRSTGCKGFLEGLSACSACVKAANQRKFKEALAKQVFMIDLCVLSYKCIYCPADELHSFKEELRQRDYQQQNLAGSDLDRLLRIKDNLEVSRAVAARVDTTPAWRVSSSLRKFWDAWLTRPQKHHQTSTEAEAYGCLARGMMDAVASGRAREFDLVLAARVASGALRTDVLVESLTTSFLAKFKDGLADCKRRTTSAFANFQVLSESLTTLGRHAEVDSLLRSFCVNPRSMPSLSLVTERYPQPFVSLNNLPVLRDSYMRGLTLLKAAGARAHLICDETTWSPDWSQVRRVCWNEAGEPVDRIVGGAWHADADKDMSLLDPDEHDRTKLPREKLAKLALHIGMARTDCTRFVFDICVLPRPQGVGSAEETLDVVARVFHECTEASGRPPNGLAFDGGSNNAKLLQTFLGLLEPEKMQSLPFFSQCSVKQIPKLPCWGFGYLTYKDEILVAMNGAWHWQKRYSLAHLSGCRKIRHGGVFVDLSCELSCGLPQAAYLASDVQSDLAACQRLSPPYTGKTWCSLGVNVHSLIGALVCSCTTGSVGFSQEDICFNAAAGYYLLLLHRSEAGRLKSLYRGQPSLKDFLHSCDVTKICRKAFAAALQTQAFISDGRSTTDLYETLLKFCGPDGDTFFGTALGESAFDMMDITPETSEWLPPEETEHKSQQQAESMQLLHAVEDRAKVLEEIQILEASDASDAPQPACQPAEQNEDAPQDPELVVELAPESGCPDIPTNLGKLLKAVLAEGGREFNLDHATSQGQAALLKRLLHMAPFIRSFAKHARLQEGVLSAAVLNECKGPLSQWNRREHELAVARRALNASQVRLSRAQAWHMAVQKMSKEVQAVNKQVDTNDPGIHAPDVYFPAGDRVQVIAFLLEDLVAVGLVLSAFRGSLVKRPNGKGAADVIVKTARPFPDELPSVSTKLVHVAECIYDAKHGEYCTSCASRCLLVDPVNCIYGQLTVSVSKPSQTRMHFRLSPASMESLRLLKQRGRLPVQPLPEVAEGEDDAAAEPQEPDAPSQVYHDRSFMRASMPAQAKKFMTDLESLYRRKGWPFVENGLVHLSSAKSESWPVLLDRIPGFLEQEFSKQQGYRFSRAVHGYLQALVPESAASVQKVKKFLGLVSRVAPGVIDLRG
ncbi:unnamed protein product [Symbiodinium sp. KB8]|nr:unnamed protein product [Symbiodinium sp. KB8]